MNDQRVPKTELDARLEGFMSLMRGRDWRCAFIFSKINQYYFTGTMQDGVLAITNGGAAVYFVRRSLERALRESLFADIRPMTNFKDVADVIGVNCAPSFADTEILTLAQHARFAKYLDAGALEPLDRVLAELRAVKSPYELALMEEAGRLHDEFLLRVIPGMLKEGMSEADMAADIYSAMVRHGHHGVSRFNMPQCEIIGGQASFGESSLYPSSFDGPAGHTGISPAAPVLGSRDRFLKKGDLVFVDMAFGLNGYHTDKTQVYSFRRPPPPEAALAHGRCLEIQRKAAGMLRPGTLPADIYATIIDGLDEDFAENFMGFGSRTVKFIGHGAGLQVDEYPPLAKGFTKPLADNMTIALEPKKGLAGLGMVGVEDTYVVSPEGGRCITGGGREIIIL